MAPEYRGGHVESAPHFPLRQTVHELSEVMRETPALALPARVRKLLGGDDAEADEERGDEGGDQRGGGAEPGLMYVGQGAAGGREGRQLFQRVHRPREML